MKKFNAHRAAVATGRSAMVFRPIRPASHQVAVSLRGPIWTAILATVCAGGLLVAFQQVVHGGVQQAEVRHRAFVAHADALLRCNYATGVEQRESCQAQVNASRRTEATRNTSADAELGEVSLAKR